MKTIGLFTIIVLLGFSCNNRKVNSKEDNRAKIEATFDSIKNYVINKTGSKEFFGDSEDNFYIKFDSKLAVLRKNGLILGYLNQDSLMDAIYSYSVSRSNQALYTSNVILLGTTDGLSIKNEFFRDMKIERIENQIIFAEQFLVGYDSPQFGCKACSEKVKLRLQGDSLVNVK